MLPMAGAACSSGSDGPGIATAAGATAQPTPTASLSDDEKRRQFAQCMRDHGIDVEDPSGNGGGVMIRGTDKNRADTAMRACQTLLPGGSLSRSLTPEHLAEMHHCTQCLRDHGVNVAAPDPNGGIRISPGPGMSKDDPRLQQAFNACQDLMPGALASGRPGGGR